MIQQSRITRRVLEVRIHRNNYIAAAMFQASDQAFLVPEIPGRTGSPIVHNRSLFNISSDWSVLPLSMISISNSG